MNDFLTKLAGPHGAGYFLLLALLPFALIVVAGTVCIVFDIDVVRTLGRILFGSGWLS